MSVSKLGNEGQSLSQRLRMLADEHEALEVNDTSRTEFLLITVEQDGSVGSGGYVVDIAAAIGGIEIAKLDLLDSYYASVEDIH